MGECSASIKPQPHACPIQVPVTDISVSIERFSLIAVVLVPRFWTRRLNCLHTRPALSGPKKSVRSAGSSTTGNIDCKRWHAKTSTGWSWIHEVFTGHARACCLVQALPPG